MNILSAHKLSCEKSDRTLFKNLDLEIQAHKLVHLKGDNGAGKTSLLRILVGLSAPVSGNVMVDGEDIHKNQNLAAKNLIYIGHKLGLNLVLSAQENLEYWMAQQGLLQDSSLILNILDELELTGLETIPVKHLSAGQQRKVALARLWLKPESLLWVLDEPFTALDVHMVKVIEDKITSFVSQGGSVIMTSHQSINISHPIDTIHLEYQW